ncbi:arylsulfatase [Sphingopyxis yananensis]|uniref:arylsulfatase n=1 Tax=Sphingopyxis yananensis TaxID=2886687 RepID=UPI001D0F9D8C|nr:arylsulfatase [Sphingopyxis yananensis]MCC2603231.1 arylsulfatase [Sphingopyxis yananensis]
MLHRFKNNVQRARALPYCALIAALVAAPASQAETTEFKGVIGQTYADSTAAFPKPVEAPAGAPNIIVVITDDVGFGAASTFGGPVPTPNLDRLAARGLIYNRFHTTAMCSPTRAALLTGRNHHAVANGIVANLSTGFPGYHNIMPKSAATVAETLRQNGYNTAMFGKHHNAPEAHVSPVGPFDMWPTGLGFEHFFGFMGAETNQFTPALYRGTEAVPTLKDGVLDKALADDAIHWIRTQKSVAPEKPFFVYYATGSAHAPLQAPSDWIQKFRGKFDAGWDNVRANTHRQQIGQGLIPKGTVSSPRPEGILAWNALTADQRKISARMMEVYAGMLAYQDDQFGRILNEIERIGVDKNTLIMFIQGDNGAAPEAGQVGSTNPMANFANDMKEDEATLLAKLDEFGGPNSVAQYGFGWVWATNSPFPMAKQIASHLGGTRNGLVLSWPDRISQRGIRSQFTHVTDITPTILEAAGIEAPAVVNGVPQQPMNGVSFAYSFNAPTAAERHDTQYFEMMGNRALYHRGWLASTTPETEPWKSVNSSKLPSEYGWELYDLTKDFSQSNNLAAKYPEKLREMQLKFDQEAKANQVYPLDNRLTIERFTAAAALVPDRRVYQYWGAGISIPSVRAAPLLGRSFTINADLVLPQQPADGVLLALGSRFGGWSFYMKDGRVHALMAASHLDGDQSQISSNQALPAGKHKVSIEFRYDGGRNAGGEMRLLANGQEIGRGRIARTISKLPEMTDTLDIGFDADTPVTNAYTSGGRFNGEIEKVEILVGQPGRAGLSTDQ